MPETIVITRPGHAADELACSLTKQGFNCLLEPVFSVDMVPDAITQLDAILAGKPQAIIVTSKNAITALAAMTVVRTTALLTVGKASADYARTRGFEHVHAAQGNADHLIKMIKRNYTPEKGALLYIRGAEISKDIAKILSRSGFVMEQVIVYCTRPVTHFSDHFLDAIGKGLIKAVLFYSQHTVNRYNSLAEKHKIADLHPYITAICISEKIAAAAAIMEWKKIMVSDNISQAVLSA